MSLSERAYHGLKGIASFSLAGALYATYNSLNKLPRDMASFNPDYHVGTPGEIERIAHGWLSLPIYVSLFITQEECIAQTICSFEQAASSEEVPSGLLSFLNLSRAFDRHDEKPTSLIKGTAWLACIPLLLNKTPSIVKRLKDIALSPEGIMNHKKESCVYLGVLGSLLYSTKLVAENSIHNYQKALAKGAPPKSGL